MYKFHSVPFTKFISAGCANNGYLRMITEGNVFFTNKRALDEKNH